MSDFVPRCVLITGGAGFIGSNLVHRVLAHCSGTAVVNLDALTYAGNLENLEDARARHGADGDGRYHFVRGDIRDFDTVAALLRGEGRETAAGPRARRIPAADAVIHLAAESHVDRSIMGPAVFVMTGGKLYTATITMTVNFLAPAKPGPITGEAKVTQLGKTIAFVEGKLAAENGAVLATATTSARLIETAKITR